MSKDALTVSASAYFSYLSISDQITSLCNEVDRMNRLVIILTSLRRSVHPLATTIGFDLFLEALIRIAWTVVGVPVR